MSGGNEYSADGEDLLIDDIDLSRYLDGEIEQDDRRRIANALESTPGLAHQAQLLRSADIKARQYADGLLESAPPARLCVRHMAAERRSRQRRNFAAIGAFLLTAIVAFGMGWMGHGIFHQQSFIARSFVEDAAATHKVYAVEVLRPVELDAANSAELTGWLSKRVGFPVIVADLTNLVLEYVGGRLLPGRNGAPSAMLMYQDADGRRATLYLGENSGTAPSSFRYFSWDEAATETVYWFDRDIGYGLTGAYERDELNDLAKSVAKAMDGG
jgi:anti-sigma factor RsiW